MPCDLLLTRPYERKHRGHLRLLASLALLLVNWPICRLQAGESQRTAVLCSPYGGKVGRDEKTARLHSPEVPSFLSVSPVHPFLPLSIDLFALCSCTKCMCVSMYLYMARSCTFMNEQGLCSSVGTASRLRLFRMQSGSAPKKQDHGRPSQMNKKHLSCHLLPNVTLLMPWKLSHSQSIWDVDASAGVLLKKKKIIDESRSSPVVFPMLSGFS